MLRGDVFAIALRRRRRHAWSDMDRPTLDERLPALYRQILGVASELERQGRRGDGLRARRRAAQAYASWDERAERKLTGLLEDARRRHLAPTPEALPARLRGRLRRSAGDASGSVVQTST